jgi:hypothetical protein
VVKISDSRSFRGYEKNTFSHSAIIIPLNDGTGYRWVQACFSVDWLPVLIFACSNFVPCSRCLYWCATIKSISRKRERRKPYKRVGDTHQLIKMEKKLLLIAVIACAGIAATAQTQVSNLTGGAIIANTSGTNANVGINNTVPLLRLHIKTPATNDGIMVEQTGTTIASLNLKANAGHRWALFSTGSGNGEGANHFGIYNYNNGGYRMFINGNTGNIGINTITPTHKLHVHNGALMLSGAVPGFGGPQLLFTDDLTTNPNGRWALEYITAAPTRPSMGGMNFWQPFPGGGGAGNYSLFLKDDGKIGMGVTDDNVDSKYKANAFPAGYRLYVNGGILTDKVKVAVYGSAQWADYVFAPGYQLKPLNEVEAFTKANKHLPGVPSAEEIVKAGGIDVSTMFAKQMEKIEELTLYMIELKKENVQLQKDVQSLKNIVASPAINK